ncbi:aspartate transaminase [Chlamydia pneumoniae TW-183]|uniref:Amino acid biosynthesis aminotransferase, class I n=2 Tax=Chlamydia pneumoniae TaxID=83558 RepID=Q9Z7G5_CHLPN|nr:aromatic amino acid transaminase [Chlamydia pneumoniae]AAD18879.1 Aromatic AA Aminotransferase [Chlamydia pneumoniae CWL029]AAF73616.1 amino acid biosynthesis aminotransferase, class I [Chlamydia pneumoniae AR39]AAP98697.1 aspartate transaminase [Chlamydia pneumoniae TW-183]CRI33261.1 Aspartate aminotransferase [Chlamydia pneumoniae]CRI36124.1 Aspartate aminotransferase [Chlamydia pneumoniae]
MSFFNHIPTFSPDAILGLQNVFFADKRPEKVNLVIGVYEHPQKRYGGLSCIRKAQTVILEEEQNKSYLPISGLQIFLDEMRELVFGAVDPSAIVGFQSLGGTGALHLGARLLSVAKGSGKVYVPEQTWSNHIRIFSQEGLEVIRYPYYSKEQKQLLFEPLIAFLKEVEKNSVILLHGCCHNPTGVDFTEDMWKELAILMKERELIPFFDTAYQGFAHGIELDRKPIEIFISEGNTVLVAASSSKNFALYGERVGYFAVHSTFTDELVKIHSFLEEKIRGEYSSPQRWGVEIVSTILSNPYLKEEWQSELNFIRESLGKMRTRFVQALRKVAGHTFDFLLSQHGFFAYPGFSDKQVLFLREQHAVYTTAGGRMNLNGITEKNIDHVVQSFIQAYEL